MDQYSFGGNSHSPVRRGTATPSEQTGRLVNAVCPMPWSSQGHKQGVGIPKVRGSIHENNSYAKPEGLSAGTITGSKKPR